MSRVTIELLMAADASNGADYYRAMADALNAYLDAYAINTNTRLAHFLAQIGHESSFRAVEENGNYSPGRMRQVFGCRGGPSRYDPQRDDCMLGPDGQPMRLRPKLWTDEALYAHNPQNLLSYVYALRLGNGDEASGDGYRYRGRGLIQLTGRDNYQAFTDCHNQKNPQDQQDFVASPDLLVSQLNYAVESAFYFWDARNVNPVADTDNVADVTFAVNGGYNGLADREARLARIKAAMG
ncbi:glycoside hydrolase family 19 protein [Massilia horti]|nr:glycoside hydrolase family 19 protein [Massilia horti]